jgi:hypothetical protein
VSLGGLPKHKEIGAPVVEQSQWGSGFIGARAQVPIPFGLFCYSFGNNLLGECGLE